MSDPELRAVLHPRVDRHCRSLYLQGHHPQACAEALKQVELALREKTGTRDYGRRLRSVFSPDGGGVTLRVPFGPELQREAEQYFVGTFGYYRNYAAHDGREIDHVSSLRAMIAASELLDLIDASDVSFEDVGGLPGLVRMGVFPTERDGIRLLLHLDGCTVVDNIVDGFFEDLAYEGYSDHQVATLVEVGLIEYVSEAVATDPIDDDQVQSIATFRLTELGRRLVPSDEEHV